MATVKYTDIVDLENEQTLRQLEMKLPLFADQYFRHLKLYVSLAAVPSSFFLPCMY